MSKIITYDGDRTGKTSSPYAENLIKVSDIPIDLNTVTRVVITNVNGNTQEIPMEYIYVAQYKREEPDGQIYEFSYLTEGTLPYVTSESDGVYFFDMNGSAWVSCIEYTATEQPEEDVEASASISLIGFLAGTKYCYLPKHFLGWKLAQKRGE